MKWLKRSLFALVVAASTTASVVAEEKKPLPAAAPTTANEVEVVKDLAYAGTDNDRQKLDLYLPKGKRLPTGAIPPRWWLLKGDRKDAAQFGEALAKQGIGVAAVGYRLYPDARHPSRSRRGESRRVAEVELRKAAGVLRQSSSPVTPPADTSRPLLGTDEAIPEGRKALAF